MNFITLYNAQTGYPEGEITFISKTNTHITFYCSKFREQTTRKIIRDSGGNEYFNYDKDRRYISDFNITD